MSKTYTRPYDYQWEGIDRIQDFRGRALLADGMGMGKTLQVLLWIWMYVQKGVVVVICPASVKWNWQREARLHLGLRAEVLEGRRPPASFFVRKNGLYVANYDIIGNPKERGTWAYVLKQAGIKVLVLDESHYLKSPTSQRTRYCKALSVGVKHVIGVSGTPLTSKPKELWSTLNIIRPDLFRSRLRFLMRYAKPEWTPWGMKYDGATRLKELHRILKSEVMIRRRKKDVLDQLPAKTRVVIPMELSNRREYLNAEKDFTKWLIKTHPKKASKARGAERLLRWGYLKRLVGELKLKAVQKWIDDYLEASDGKMIVFGVHKKVVKPLNDRYKKISERIDGSVTGKKRQAAIDRFTKVKDCRLMFGNIQAAGVGWNGQVAQDVAFTELDRQPALHTQAEDRAHRIGQKKQVTVYYLIGLGTIEEREVKVIQERQHVLDKVLDGKVDKEGFDVLDKVEEYLIKKGRKR